MKVISRRRLLEMLGLAGGATALRSLAPRRARADASIPTRFVVFYTEHGNLPAHWTPKPAAGNQAPTETAWELNDIHQSMAPYKDKLNFFDGMDMLNAYKGSPNHPQGHTFGHTYSLTAADTQDADGKVSGGPSIDQHIAQFINAPSPVTQLPSIELSIFQDPLGISFERPGPGMPRIIKPLDAWKKLFPQGPMPDDTLLARRQSVLDQVTADFAALTPRLAHADRVKLEAHTQEIRDLEMRLQLMHRGCTTPDQSTFPSNTLDAPVDGAPGSTAATAYNTMSEQTSDAHMRIIQTAFACDITRVASISFHDPPNQITGLVPGKVYGTTTATNVHGMMHTVSIFGGADKNNAESLGIAKNIAKKHGDEFAKLLGYLASIPEADGQTVLDHTVVLWSGELGDAGHFMGNLPLITAGSAGGYFKTGRYMKFNRRTDDINQFNQMWPYMSRGRSHADLLVSLANAFGSPITTFGRADLCTGPINEIRA